ncbi:MAG: PAS domain S-box protein [Ignavibacteriales bacterium]|nr:PAS domain S-box protein [Ignavibacteriales bacterium]
MALLSKGLVKKICKILDIPESGLLYSYASAAELLNKEPLQILFIESGFLTAKEWLIFNNKITANYNYLCFVILQPDGQKLPRQVINNENIFIIEYPFTDGQLKLTKRLLTGVTNGKQQLLADENGERFFSDSLELIEDMAWVFDESFALPYANKQARQFTLLKTGIPFKEGMSIRDFYPPEVNPEYLGKWKALFLKAFQGERSETNMPLLGSATPFSRTILHPRKFNGKSFVIATVRDMGTNVTQLAAAQVSQNMPANTFTDVLFVFDKTGRFIECKAESTNCAVPNLPELTGKNITDVMPADLSAAMLTMIDAAFASSKMQVLQYSMFFNGQLHYFEAKFALLDEQKVVAVIRDISSVKLSEIITVENEKRFLLMLEHTGQILYDYDIVNKSIKWLGNTGKLESLLGVSIAKLGYSDWMEMIHPDDRAMVALQRKLASETGGVFQIEHRLVLPNDVQLLIEDRGAYLYNEQGEAYRVLGTMNDITKHRDTFLALQKSEERYKAFVSQSSEAIWCFEIAEPVDINLPVEKQVELFFEHGYLADCNLAYARMYGVTDLKEILGMPLSTVLVKEDESNIRYLSNFIRNTYSLDNAESVETDMTGKRKFFLNNLVGVVKNGFIERAWGTQRDITHLKLVEEAQKTAEKKYRDIFDNAIEGIYQSSMEGFFLNVNPAMAHMYGYDSPFEMMQIVRNIGLQCYDATSERVKFLGLINQLGKVQGFESIAVKKDGSKFWISENARMIENENTREVHIEGMVEDITRRKVAIQNLSEREELYRGLVEQSPDAIAVYLNNVIVFANPSCFELLGATVPDQIIGKAPLSFVHPDSRPVAIERIQKLMSEHIAVPAIEEKFLRIDGGVLFVEVAAMSIHWGGQPAVQVIARDLSSRKRDEFIRESENTVFSMIAQTTTLQSILNKICELNDYFYENCHTVIYLNIRGTLVISAAPSIRYELRKPLETLEQAGIVLAAVKLKMPFFLQDLSIEKQWSEYAEAMEKIGYRACWAKPIADMKGSVHGAIVSYFTRPAVTQLYNERIAEHFVNLAIIAIEKRKLEEENFNLSLVARQTTSAVSILDNEFQTIWINEGYEKLTGYKLEEMRGKVSSELLHGPQTDRALTEGAIDELSRNSSIRYETFNYTREGRGFWVSVQIDKMYDTKNNHIGYFMIENDITERVEQEKIVKEARSRAEEASRLKSAFLANMSHEIRTPMNGILGFADILRAELIMNGQEELYKFSETIYNSGRRLLNLLNDILDISRIEADRLDIELHECRLDEILLKTITLLKPLAERKGLILDYSGIRKLQVLADENRLHQVFNNIIGNAIKFTSKGSVTISTQVIDTKEGKQAKISIADTGRGIDASFLDFIFEPFMQESTGFSRSHEGSGLGLAISQRLIKLMNGNIILTSEVLVGTTVDIYIAISEEKFYPIIDARVQEDLTVEFAVLAKRRPKVFIVEDDETSRSLFERSLHDFAEIRLAANGDEALIMYESAITEKWVPDILLMDIGLPSPWDGIKLRAEMYRRFSQFAATPVIAQTAYAMREEKENFLKEGFSMVLTKPLNKREILQALTLYSAGAGL